jgi:hypothetical protein
MDDQTDIIQATPSDRAAEAFEALTTEVALLRSAIGGIAAERAAIPDYTQTLGEIAGGIGNTYQAVRRLCATPALKLTPEEIGQQISAAAQAAREQDRLLLLQALSALQRAVVDTKIWMDAVRTRRQQTAKLVKAAGAGAVLGALLWAVLPGAVIRQAPVSWAWQEKMAARSLHLSMWDAGERMMRLADPERWRQVVLDSAATPAKRPQTAVSAGQKLASRRWIARRAGH